MAGISTWVQFFRNLLCVVRTLLGLSQFANVVGSSTILKIVLSPVGLAIPEADYYSKSLSDSFGINVDLCKVSNVIMITFLVALLQFAAVISNTDAAARDMISGLTAYSKSINYAKEVQHITAKDSSDKLILERM